MASPSPEVRIDKASACCRCGLSFKDRRDPSCSRKSRIWSNESEYKSASADGALSGRRSMYLRTSAVRNRVSGLRPPYSTSVSSITSPRMMRGTLYIVMGLTCGLENEVDRLIVRIRCTRAGDLVVAAFLLGVTADSAMNERSDAAAPAGSVVTPAHRHFIAREEAAPVGLRIQIERPEAPCLRSRTGILPTGGGIQKKWDFPRRYVIAAKQAGPRANDYLRHAISVAERRAPEESVDGLRPMVGKGQALHAAPRQYERVLRENIFQAAFEAFRRHVKKHGNMGHDGDGLAAKTSVHFIEKVVHVGRGPLLLLQKCIAPRHQLGRDLQFSEFALGFGDAQAAADRGRIGAEA